MQADNSQPSTADIRQFLTESFSDDELATLCFDYFRDVYDDFASGMTKGQKIQLLIERCERRGILSNLLAAIQSARPEQYKERFPRITIPPQPRRRERDPRQVFISHAHQDDAFAHRLAVDLQKYGWQVWIAPNSIRPGEKWAEAIDRGLAESGVFIVILTPAAIQSRWVKDETYAAIELEKKGQIRFVPLYVKPCDVPSLWNVYQHVSFCGDYADGLRELLAALEQTSQFPPQGFRPTTAPSAYPLRAKRNPLPCLLAGAGIVALAVVCVIVAILSSKSPVMPTPTRIPERVALTMASSGTPTPTPTHTPATAPTRTPTPPTPATATNTPPSPTTAPTAPPHPATVPTPIGGGTGEIAFASERDGNMEIYLMNADGSNVRRLTNNPAQEGTPSWSPDGRSMVFDSLRDGNWEVYIMDANGNNVRNLTRNGANDLSPKWSPTGSKIAFLSNRDGNNEIYVMNPDGSGQENLTRSRASEGGATWSPDGQRIAFGSDRDGNSEVYVMNADGSNQTRLTFDEAWDGNPAWSPDGRWIAFFSNRVGAALYLIPPTGGTARKLTDCSPWGFPAWSPDSSQVAYVLTSAGDLEIWRVRADGSEPTKLTDHRGIDNYPAWRPAVSP